MQLALELDSIYLNKFLLYEKELHELFLCTMEEKSDTVRLERHESE